MKYSLPEHIQPTHDLTEFDCGKPVLNNWLKKQALKNEKQRVSRTYVVCCEGKVVAYYSIASGSVIHSQVPNKIKRNTPDPIPVMILGKLAVDVNHAGKGLGKSLVKDAAQRILQVSEIVGIRAILIHALDEDAQNFYVEKCGFTPSPVDPLLLLITLKEVQENFL